MTSLPFPCCFVERANAHISHEETDPTLLVVTSDNILLGEFTEQLFGGCHMCVSGDKKV